MNKLPELLLPAGDLEKAYIAFEYGADAIYCGIPMFSLRTRMNVVSEIDIEEIIKYAHGIGKKVYITINGFPHQTMIKLLRKHLEFLSKVMPDGLIIADSGVLFEANQICPKIPKHLSVQASTVSESGMRFWFNNGVRRIILAREIPIKEVKEIHKLFPEIELEYFVHGAVCMAYSGRCLLSNFMAYRDANRGMCAHSCRWNYRAIEEGEDIRDFEMIQILEEEKRPGEHIHVEQDFHGTHIMSSRDMCMIEHLKEIIDAGVCSVKIEGRNKTIYYLASTGRAYRKALDDIKEGNRFDESLWNEIHATANRGFFAGFLHGKPHIEGQQYEANRSTSTHEYCGKVLNFFKKGDILNEDLEGLKKGHIFKESRILAEIKNRIEIGNILTFLYPIIKDDKSIKSTKFWKDKEEVDVIHGGNGNAWIKVPLRVSIKEGVLIRQEVRNDGLKIFNDL